MTLVDVDSCHAGKIIAGTRSRRFIVSFSAYAISRYGGINWVVTMPAKGQATTEPHEAKNYNRCESSSFPISV